MSYENQHKEMMSLLNLPMEDGDFKQILQAIQKLKDQIDENETNHWTNAYEILKTIVIPE